MTEIFGVPVSPWATVAIPAVFAYPLFPPPGRLVNRDPSPTNFVAVMIPATILGVPVSPLAIVEIPAVVAYPDIVE